MVGGPLDLRPPAGGEAAPASTVVPEARRSAAIRRWVSAGTTPGAVSPPSRQTSASSPSTTLIA